MRIRLFVITLLILPLLSGCETVQEGVKEISTALDPDAPRPKSREPTRTPEDLLTAGITRFEEGDYGQAQRLLQSSLAEGLATRVDQARAYKYLAFIYCVTDRTAQCREEFNNALSADPKFTLSPAEIGHPDWGPVFRSVSGR